MRRKTYAAQAEKAAEARALLAHYADKLAHWQHKERLKTLMKRMTVLVNSIPEGS